MNYFLAIGRLHKGELFLDELLRDAIEGLDAAMESAKRCAVKFGKTVYVVEATREDAYYGPRWVYYDVPARPPVATADPDYSKPEAVRMALDSLRRVHLLDDDDVEAIMHWADDDGPYPDCAHGDGRYDAAAKLIGANDRLYRALYDRWAARQPRFVADPRWAQPTAR